MVYGIILCFIALYCLMVLYCIMVMYGIMVLCVYGIYETTNYALFNEWKPHIVVTDTIWGGILFSSSYFLFNLL